MRISTAFVIACNAAFFVDAFVPQMPTVPSPAIDTLSSSALKLAPILPTDPQSIDTARTAFFIWAFGASGGAGIARSSFPRMYNSVKEIQSLKGVGPTKGGETLGISPLCGYPEDLCIADVKQVLNNKLNVEQIVNKYPIEGNFLSKKGYLTYAAFKQANQNANPLVVRAIFDTLNSSVDVCSPDIAQSKFDSYKEDMNNVKKELLKSKLQGYSSIIFLLFLLALADWEAFAVHGRQGWFPEWPGLTDLPGSLFDPEIGLQAIPKYWLGQYK